MSVDSSVSSVSSTSQAAATATSKSSVSAKSSSDTSFKDEMNKVDKSVETPKKEVSDNKESSVKQDISDNQNNQVSQVETKLEEKKFDNPINNANNIAIAGNISTNNNYLSLSDANNLLANDIKQMINNTSDINSLSSKSWIIGFDNNNQKSNLIISESDAEFFLNLTQNNDISINGIVSQAQSMLNNNTVSVTEVKQNVQVSQTLLNALNEARQNNQPLRIDFDQNIAVILRIGKDGSLSANFIPGDKAAEQYLKSNIESLRNTFEEKDLPYTELSYSNSSKRENERRRNKQQQGE